MTGPEILKIAGEAGVERIAHAVEQTDAWKSSAIRELSRLSRDQIAVRYIESSTYFP
jgi:hypothetical protein